MMGRRRFAVIQRRVTRAMWHARLGRLHRIVGAWRGLTWMKLRGREQLKLEQAKVRVLARFLRRAVATGTDRRRLGQWKRCQQRSFERWILGFFRRWAVKYVRLVNDGRVKRNFYAWARLYRRRLQLRWKIGDQQGDRLCVAFFGVWRRRARAKGRARRQALRCAHRALCSRGWDLARVVRVHYDFVESFRRLRIWALVHRRLMGPAARVLWSWRRMAINERLGRAAARIQGLVRGVQMRNGMTTAMFRAAGAILMKILRGFRVELFRAWRMYAMQRINRRVCRQAALDRMVRETMDNRARTVAQHHRRNVRQEQYGELKDLNKAKLTKRTSTSSTASGHPG